MLTLRARGALSFLLSISCYLTAAAAEAQQATDPSYQSFVLSLINQDRARNRVRPVAQSAQLSRVAQMYADYLLRTGSLAHVDRFGRNPQDRAALFGITADVSENLAYEMSTSDEPQALLQQAQAGMMNEPRNQINHRFNILNPQSRFVGIGVAQRGDEIVVVQEFAAAER